MKIMLFVNSMGSGGAERVAATLVSAWAERGDTVTLVATYTGRGTCAYDIPKAVRFVYLADLIGQTGRGAGAYLARFYALRRLIRGGRPDVIVSFLTNVNIAVIAGSLGLRVPVIACEHNNPAADGRSPFWDFLCRLFYPRASAVTLLTESAVKPFAARIPGTRRLAVVPNPLPDGLPDALPASLCDPAPETRLTPLSDPPPAPGAEAIPQSGRKRLIAVGRLCRQKQFDLLIRVFATLSAEFPEWDLWIWGEGPDRRELEAEVAAAGLQKRVRLPGTTGALWQEMLRARAFVLSSRYEGLPMAMMEAMALGLPTVAFDCPSGPRELTANGRDGLLVAPGDAAALTAALRRVLADASLRAELGARASASVRERYSRRAVLGIWDALFAEVGAAPVSHLFPNETETA